MQQRRRCDDNISGQLAKKRAIFSCTVCLVQRDGRLSVHCLPDCRHGEAAVTNWTQLIIENCTMNKIEKWLIIHCWHVKHRLYINNNLKSVEYRVINYITKFWMIYFYLLDRRTPLKCIKFNRKHVILTDKYFKWRQINLLFTLIVYTSKFNKKMVKCPIKRVEN